MTLCCRYLGYALYNYYVPGRGPIWLDKVQCRGSETDIGQCPHQPWGYNDCNHQDDVSVACYVHTMTAAQTTTGQISSIHENFGISLEKSHKIQLLRNVPSLFYACMHACIHSFMHSFIHSFIHSLTQSFMFI